MPIRALARLAALGAALSAAPASAAPAAAPVPPPPPQPLTLAALLTLAQQNSPDLAAARAAADVARGRLVQAGLYPNPVVTSRIDELGNPLGEWGKPGVTIAQEVVTHGKLRLAKEAAAQGVDAAEWQALTRWRDAALRVRLAWVDALAAGREVEVNELLAAVAKAALEGVNTALGAGKGSQADLPRATVEKAQADVRLAVARQRLESARRVLAAAIGLPALPEGQLSDHLDAAAPEYTWEGLREAMVSRSSELREAEALARQADALARRAEADRFPNLTLAARPFYSNLVDEHNVQVLVEVGAPLPLYNRNQGNIAAAKADAARLWGLARDRELRLTERLAAAFQRYQSGRRQADVYREQVLKGARESLRLIRLAYDRGDPRFDFTAVLQAQQVLAQAELTQVQALAEQWRALAEIIALLQEDEPYGAAPVGVCPGPQGPALPAYTEPR
jgi:cobalt-zinc-cadmium efflux system outer membrane protein